MASSRRVNVSFSPRVYRALKAKSARTGRGLSELVNEAVQNALSEDAIDEELIRSRAKEPSRSYSKVSRDLKRGHLV